MSDELLEQRQGFLAEPRVGVFAIERPGKIPLAAPIWYDYTVGGTVQIWTSRESAKGRLITAAGRFALVVQDPNPPYQWVRAEGPLGEVRDATEDDVIRIARRYVAEDQIQPYVDYNTAGDYAIFAMRPERFAGWKAD